MKCLRELLKEKRHKLNMEDSSLSKEIKKTCFEERARRNSKKYSIKKSFQIEESDYISLNTTVGSKFTISKSFFGEVFSCFEREYIKEKNEKQKLKDKAFRVAKLKELKRKGFNSQKIGLLVEYANENIEWSLLGDFISLLFKEPLDPLKKYFYSIQRSTKLLLGSVALEENRVLLN